MLTTVTTRLCIQQAPVAVGLLLRGPRVAHAARLPPAPRHCPPTRRSLSVSASAGMGGPEYLVLDYDYTHHDAELLARREPYLEDHLRLCRQAVRFLLLCVVRWHWPA